MTGARSILGYGWAVACTFVVLACFLGNVPLSRAFVKATGLSVSPWFSGGPVARTVPAAHHRTIVHRPVFDGLLGPRDHGFVQVEFQLDANAPATLEEGVDCDGDGRVDFTIAIDANGRGRLTGRTPRVTELEQLVKVKEGFVARIGLQR